MVFRIFIRYLSKNLTFLSFFTCIVVIFFQHSLTVFADEDDIEDLISCPHQEYKDILLLDQFSPTGNQGEYGVCYSFAAIGAIEAAIYRNTGSHLQFSPQAAACNYAFKRKIDKSSIDAFVVGKRKYLFDGGWPLSVAEQLLQDGPLVFPSFFEDEWICINEDMNRAKNTIPGVRNPLERGFFGLITWWNDVDVESFQSDRLYEEARRQKIKFESKMSHVKKNNLQGYRVKLIQLPPSVEIATDKAVREKANKKAKWNHPTTWISDKVFPECDLNNKDMQKFVRALMSPLCEGVPVITSLYMSGVEITDGGVTGSFGSFSTGLFPITARHAMQLVGVKKYDGKPYFVFRNSWKEGNDDNPQRSLARIPLDEVCRIFDAGVVVGPRDRLR